MTRHTRINTIISLLQQGPQTVESMTRHFQSIAQDSKDKVSPRQIRTDIGVIRAMNLCDETEFEKTGAANRKTWQIKTSSYDRNTQRLNQGVLPQVFANKRQQSLERLYNWQERESDEVIDSTHFYETVARVPLDEKLETVIKAIDTGRKLRLIDMEGDATSVRSLVRFPLVILPVKTLYHRGCFYLAAVTDNNHEVMTFQIDQLDMQETDELFRRNEWVKVVEADLKNRFGVTQNMDRNTYEINLRFSSTTGEFVKNQFWHHDMNEQRLDNGDWLITFSCGINRELVGWLFQWMSNVRVVGPLKLNELYDEQLARLLTIQNQQPDEPLAYTNAFAPVADQNRKLDVIQWEKKQPHD